MIKTALVTTLCAAALFVACTASQKLSGAVAATATPQGWKAFKADSGYQIEYPLDDYSIRNSPSPSSVLMPGIETLVPNDSFYYTEPRTLTYRLSIAVSDNGQHLSLDDPKALLAHSAIKPYDPSALAYHSIQVVLLNGAKAYRVDGLQIDPNTAITSQIITIHKDLIYELMVEPHQLTGNQAEPLATGTVTPENKELIEKIIETFQFSN
jgi:hypothetical protein